MPKDKGQEHMIDVPYPITPEEVRGMVAAVDKRQRLKDLTDENYIDLAVWLSGMTRKGWDSRFKEFTDYIYTPTEADIRFRQRWNDAVRLLMKTRDHPDSFNFGFEASKATDILQAAFYELSRLLDGSLKPFSFNQTRKKTIQTKRWVFHAMPIAHTMSGIVQDCGGPGGTGRNSIAARFAAAACERIGWLDEHCRPIKASAIARYCEDKPATSNDHNLP